MMGKNTRFFWVILLDKKQCWQQRFSTGFCITVMSSIFAGTAIASKTKSKPESIRRQVHRWVNFIPALVGQMNSGVDTLQKDFEQTLHKR